MKQVFDFIIYFASFCTAVSVVLGFTVKWLDKKLITMLEPIKTQIHKMDVKECRRFLIDFLLDIEVGIPKDEVQHKFAHDVYDHYTKELKENSYVKEKWERIMINDNK